LLIPSVVQITLYTHRYHWPQEQRGAGMLYLAGFAAGRAGVGWWVPGAGGGGRVGSGGEGAPEGVGGGSAQRGGGCGGWGRGPRKTPQIALRRNEINKHPHPRSYYTFYDSLYPHYPRLLSPTIHYSRRGAGAGSSCGAGVERGVDIETTSSYLGF